MRALRFTLGLAVAIATDLRAIAWKHAMRKLDELAHGRRCDCPTDECLAEPPSRRRDP